jgi:hypothetical protein
VGCVRIKGPGRQRGILCTPDTTLVDPDPDCPNAANHEPFPRGYIAASEHADRLMQTHTQTAPCPGCNRWCIWTPRTDLATTDLADQAAA